MFRLQENVPEVYVKESRDFQLFCRIYDMINNSLRFNASSAIHLLNPLKTNDRMLQLLATRVGFFPKHEYNTEALRQVISAFPYVIKYKGSKQGIEMALNVILKIENNYQESIVILNNENATVSIYTKTRIQSEDLLRDVLSYILPIGYDLYISTYISKDLSDNPSQLGINAIHQEKKYNAKDLSISIPEEPDSGDTLKNNAIGSYTTTQVLGAKDLIQNENSGENS